MEDRESKDDEVFREMWKAVKISAREIRIVKTKEEESKERVGKEEGRS